MINERELVVKLLTKMKSDDAYSNIVFNNAVKAEQLTHQQISFAAMLFYGTLERKITLDYILKKYCKKPLSKQPEDLRNILRTAVYQLLFMDSVPDSAAVNEAVKLTKSMGFERVSGFVNGVLRSFLRDNKEYTIPPDATTYLSIKYSVLQWISKSFIDEFGAENAEGILAGFFEHNNVFIRVNTTKISTDNLLKSLSNEGVNAEKSDVCEDALILKNCGNVTKLCGFEKGYFHVQDISSQLCAKALNPQKGDRVLDICAAPGGKTFTVAELMNNEGDVFAGDIYEQKIGLIKESAERLGLSCVNAFVNDAQIYNSDIGKFNKVLCDLPCSGLGILGKKPEIRYKNVVKLDKLQNLQYDLLVKSSQYVEPGGILVYSTCTLRRVENTKNAEKFIALNPEFEPYPILPQLKRVCGEPENMITLLPHIHGTDGFFISAFRRRNDCE